MLLQIVAEFNFFRRTNYSSKQSPWSEGIRFEGTIYAKYW